MIEKYILPSDEDAKRYSAELRGSDAAWFLITDVPIAYAFDGFISFEDLEKGLINTLNRIPVLAGRLIVESTNRLAFSTVGSPGAVLQFHKSSRKKPKNDAESKAWDEYFPGMGLGSKIIPSGAFGPFRRPLLRCRLTHTADGSVLAIQMSHLVGDGASLCDFVHMWSWETGNVSKTGKHPQNNVKEVNCDRRMPTVPKAEDVSEEAKQKYILTPADLGVFLAIAVKARVADHVLDLVISKQEWENVKLEAMKGLKEGEWVSSYEAIMSILLISLGKAQQKKNVSGRSLVNLRTRSKLFHDNYFGVGLGGHEFELDITKSLGEVAFSFHEGLRKGIADPSKMEEQINTLELYGGHLSTEFFGSYFRLKLVSWWKKALLDSQPVTNSWVGYNWFKVDFGLNGETPKFLRVHPTFRFRNHVHIYPRSEDEFALRIQLPPAEMKNFKKEMVKCGFFKQAKM